MQHASKKVQWKIRRAVLHCNCVLMVSGLDIFTVSQTSAVMTPNQNQHQATDAWTLALKLPQKCHLAHAVARLVSHVHLPQRQNNIIHSTLQ